MGPSAAEAVAEALRRAAVHDARRHLAAAHLGALDSAQSHATSLVDAVVTGRRPHQRRIARILQDLYVQTYKATVDGELGRGLHPVLAGDVNAVATAVRTNLGPSRVRDSALKVATVVWSRSRYDGIAAAVRAWETLDAVSAIRAGELVPGSPTLDGVRQLMLAQWYRRCYLAEARAEMGVLTPLQEVTDGEVRAVAAAWQQGEPHRLVGDDGVPLVTAHGTVTSPEDRKLDAGEVGVVEAMPSTRDLARRRAAGFWSGLSEPDRTALLTETAALRRPLVEVLARKDFRQLAVSHQDAVTVAYLGRLAAAEPQPFRLAHPLSGPAEETTAAMFNLSPISPATAAQRVAAAALLEAVRPTATSDQAVRSTVALAAAGSVPFSREPSTRATAIGRDTKPQTPPAREHGGPSPGL